VLGEKVCDVPEEDQAGDSLETGIAVRKVPPDIPECRRTQKSIGDGMEEQIGVGMSLEAAIMRDIHSADDARSSRNEAVDIVSKSYPSSGRDGFT
jgi:hypothetical protein